LETILINEFAIEETQPANEDEHLVTDSLSTGQSHEEVEITPSHCLRLNAGVKQDVTG
jgi:hypothetical protein